MTTETWCDDCRGYGHVPWCPLYQSATTSNEHKGQVMERREQTADEAKFSRLAARYRHDVNLLTKQRDKLVVILKEAMKIVSDRAAGGRMLTTAEEASAVWNRCAKAIFDIKEADAALVALATVEQDSRELVE